MSQTIRGTRGKPRGPGCRAFQLRRGREGQEGSAERMLTEALVASRGTWLPFRLGCGEPGSCARWDAPRVPSSSPGVAFLTSASSAALARRWDRGIGLNT